MAEPEIDSLEAPTLVKAAAAIQGVSGIYVALSAVQLLISGEFVGPLVAVQYLNWALVALGGLQIVLALGTLRARLGSAVASTAIAWILAPTIVAWAAICVSVSIFSCTQAGAILLAASAALISPFAIGPTKKAEAVRKKLAAEGMDLGM